MKLSEADLVAWQGIYSLPPGTSSFSIEKEKKKGKNTNVTADRCNETLLVPQEWVFMTYGPCVCQMHRLGILGNLIIN